MTFVDLICVAGWLKKQASSGLFKAWQPRYFVLYENSRELRYYGRVAESIFGNVPLQERGSIPLEFINKIEVPELDNRGGKRFDVYTNKVGDAAYPRDSQSAPTSGGSSSHARVYCFEAPTIHDRQEWVRHLRALTGLAPPGTPFSPGATLLSTSTDGGRTFAQALSPSEHYGRTMYSMTASGSLSPSMDDLSAAPTGRRPSRSLSLGAGEDSTRGIALPPPVPVPAQGGPAGGSGLPPSGRPTVSAATPAGGDAYESEQSRRRGGRA